MVRVDVRVSWAAYKHAASCRFTLSQHRFVTDFRGMQEPTQFSHKDLMLDTQTTPSTWYGAYLYVAAEA